jgi:site-specific DNA recombinase
MQPGAAIGRVLRLRFLAPDIVTAILDGRQPVELTSRTLLRIADLPLDWSGQRQALGLA